ncbi:MAG: cobalt ECF transporter T component CbiQ [Syntrophomonadaceae bacterium]
MKNHAIGTLPAWMADPASDSENTGRKGGGTSFLHKTLREIKTALANDLQTEQLAAQPGLLQKIDPRIKLLGLIILVTAAGLTRSIAALLFLAVLSAALMLASRLPVWTLQRRIWGIIPLISLLAAAPGMLSIFNPGVPLVVLLSDPEVIRIGSFNLAGPIYISQQGVTAAVFLFIRTGLSLSLGTLLVLTTPVNRLLHSIKVLKVPTLMVMILEMSYRYLILLLTVSLEMFEARKMRTVGAMKGSTQRRVVGSSVAALFERSISLSDEVFQAMTARGYTGEAVSIEPLALRTLDFTAFVFIIGLAATTVFWRSFFG